MIFVLGSDKYTFAAGVKDDMPFFAIREVKGKPDADIYVGEQATEVIEKFSDGGAIIYFDNQVAAENFHKVMAFIFESAINTTQWPETKSKEKMQ